MKIVRQENFHVKAYPGTFYNEEQAYEYSRELENEINRHCDSVGSTEVDCDTIEYCEFCEREWEEDSSGQPVCCDAAIVDWERSKYCYQCFEKTVRTIKREGQAYWEPTSPVRCERCKRWFCSICFEWRSSGLCKECQVIVEGEKKRVEEEKQSPGRKIRP